LGSAGYRLSGLVDEFAKYGVKSTPAFFINEDRYHGAWDLDSLLGALDEESVFSWRQNKNK
jgi:hypothetical protein